MKKSILILIAALALPVSGANYSVVPNWASVPTGEKQIGSMHGDVAVSSKGEVYVSVHGGPKRGVQVYSAKGQVPAQRAQGTAGFSWVCHQEAK